MNKSLRHGERQLADPAKDENLGSSAKVKRRVETAATLEPKKRRIQSRTSPP